MASVIVIVTKRSVFADILKIRGNKITIMLVTVVNFVSKIYNTVNFL